MHPEGVLHRKLMRVKHPFRVHVLARQNRQGADLEGDSNDFG
jgi:hypothetical protein